MLNHLFYIELTVKRLLIILYLEKNNIMNKQEVINIDTLSEEHYIAKGELYQPDLFEDFFGGN